MATFNIFLLCFVSVTCTPTEYEPIYGNNICKQPIPGRDVTCKKTFCDYRRFPLFRSSCMNVVRKRPPCMHYVCRCNAPVTEISPPTDPPTVTTTPRDIFTTTPKVTVVTRPALPTPAPMLTTTPRDITATPPGVIVVTPG